MIWGTLKLAIWFGVAFALTTVVVAVSLAFIVGAIGYGILSPTRTPASSLRALAANASEGIAHVKTLRPT